MTRDEMDEIKRHFDVVMETLRDEVGTVAEGHAMLADGLGKVAQEVRELREQNRHEFAELRSLIKLSYAELEGRVTRLEGALVEVVGRLDRLEKGKTA
ncbi:MAG: hypothetical protein ACM3O7_01865 [Acidobacteriota bacterium]